MTTGVQDRVVLVTGALGGLGQRLCEALECDYRVVRIDLACDEGDHCYECDITSTESVERVLEEIRQTYGDVIDSVLHLAAYFDFTGEKNPLYEQVNVQGTRRLLACLQAFEVRQFVYTSTMLVHAPCEPGLPIDEQSPLAPAWAYPESKLETERVIDAGRRDIPTVILRLAGGYDEHCGLPILSHQIQRIFENRPDSHLFSGDPSRGQAFVHAEDVVDAVLRTVRSRDRLEPGTRILIGEERVLTYESLQNRIGRLTHGRKWRTLRVPKLVAAAGSWLQEKGEPIVPDSIDRGEKPFIRPFMVRLADDHYELDTTRAKTLLGWSPRHHIANTLPVMIQALLDDPRAWYEANDLTPPPELADPEPKPGSDRVR